MATRIFDSFEWFVVMETGVDGNTIYKAMQVEDTGLLQTSKGGRCHTILLGRGFAYRYSSSFNQPMYIGNSHSQPSEIYVRLHELLARIFYLRGHAAYYNYDSDDE